MKGGFATFIKMAWNEIVPGQLQFFWHLQEIATVLEEIAWKRLAGHGSETVISVPPASGKSSIACILFQPWVWTFWPESQWISSTYESKLAMAHSAKSRDLVKSDWYQSHWPIDLIKDSESFWANNKGGTRIATGTGGAVTGKHAHFQLGDDLIKEQDVRVGSSIKIQGVLERASGFWFGTMGTREVNPGKTAKILIGQRLAVKDPPGIAIADYDYNTVVFPAHFDPDRRDLRDHRSKKGELLCPERQDEKSLKELEIRLGPMAASAQLEQAPVPLGGAVIKTPYLSHRYQVLPQKMRRSIEERKVGPYQHWITSWDLAFKGEVSSDWVVGQVWCRTGGEILFIDQIRGQLGFNESIQAFTDLHARYPFISEHIFEDAANAAAVVDSMQAKIPGMILEPHGGGVLARVQFCLGIWASGAVKLPADAPFMGGADGFIVEHTNFSGLKSDVDDQVSASSLAIKYLVGGDLGIGSFVRAMEGLAGR